MNLIYLSRMQMTFRKSINNQKMIKNKYISKLTIIIYWVKIIAYR